ELPGILKWAVDGFQLWKQEGLSASEPDIIKKQRQDYRTEMDVVQRFIEEQCIVNPLAEIKSSELWTNYKTWAKDNFEYVGSNKWLSGEIKKRFEQKRRKDGQYFVGIRMNDEAAKYFENEYVQLDFSQRVS